MIADGGRATTRDRLLAAALRLFAERGYAATTVGEIEEMAGLQPRRGSLYKHFPGKAALLEAAVGTHVGAVRAGSALVDDLDLSDPRADAIAMGRWLLGELDRQRDVMRILEHDGDRLRKVRDRVRQEVSDAGFAAGVHLLERWFRGHGNLDAHAVSVALIGAVINYRRSSWTFGAPPLGLDDERFLEGWGDVCAAVARLV